MIVDTWQDAIDKNVSVRGYPGIVLKVRHIHGNLQELYDTKDFRYGWGPPPRMADCVCELVAGNPPANWERVLPWGDYYRVPAKEIRFLSPLERLALEA